ncbi:hypothetical protein [Deinococcus sonorensis]|uniref:DUF2069 domain-containing protein n=2 Tax=Deinococcus sonorensis TaxID=309891 RepID=A0AAU7U6M4_9DEIO
MNAELSVLRLNLLRLLYLMLVVGTGFLGWSELLASPERLDLSRGVVVSILGAVSLLSILGLKYPLQMLPLLFWEIAWKTIWLLSIFLPLWRSGQASQGFLENAVACSLVALFYVVMPWSYVYRHYWKKTSETWRRAATAAVRNVH